MRFEKLPKVFSGALQYGFRSPDVCGSLVKRTLGILDQGYLGSQVLCMGSGSANLEGKNGSHSLIFLAIPISHIVKYRKYHSPPLTFLACKRCTRPTDRKFSLDAFGIFSAGFAATCSWKRA